MPANHIFVGGVKLVKKSLVGILAVLLIFSAVQGFGVLWANHGFNGYATTPNRVPLDTSPGGGNGGNGGNGDNGDGNGNGGSGAGGPSPSLCYQTPSGLQCPS